jgi:hypothetical protein
MTPSSAPAPPSNEFADALRAGSPRKEAHQAGANSQSSLKRTEYNLVVLFRELELLARWRSLSERDTYSSGR